MAPRKIGDTSVFRAKTCAARIFSTPILSELWLFPRYQIEPLLSRFETARLDGDLVPIGSLTSSDRAVLAAQNLVLENKLAGGPIVPSFVALNERGEALGSLEGRRDAKEFAAFLERALTKHRLGPTDRPSK